MPSKRQAKRKIPSKELRAIWDEVPAMKDCKGECQSSCGPIPIAGEERDLVEARGGKKLDFSAESWNCNMLSATGYCTVYSVRPLICRIWGATKRLPCDKGCEPERWLTDDEAMALHKRVEKLNGDMDGKQAVAMMLAKMSPQQRRDWNKYRVEYHRQHGYIGDGRT
jgi:Fe-S-cluster containining protein